MVNEYEKLLTDINIKDNIYMFNPELVSIINELRSPDVMSKLNKEEIIEIYNKYKSTNINSIAGAIYMNDNIDKDVINEIIHHDQPARVLMFVLGRNNVDETAIEKVIEWLGKTYIMNKISDFEFVMEDAHSSFTFKDCPLSEKVISMLKSKSKDWDYIYEKYMKDNNEALDIIKNNSDDTERMAMLAYNGNLKDDIRDIAFDIAYNPVKLHKFATPHMVDTMYLSAAESLFYTEKTVPDYQKATNYAVSVISGLLSANKLYEEHMFDFVCRFKDSGNDNGQMLLEKIAEKTTNPYTIKLILETPKIKDFKIERNVLNNPNMPLDAYEKYILGLINRVLELQDKKMGVYETYTTLEKVIRLYNHRECYIPYDLVNKLKDEGLKYTMLIKCETPVQKEKLCKTELDKNIVAFFDKISKTLKNKTEKRVVEELFKKALYCSSTKNNMPIKLNSWNSMFNTVLQIDGITFETAKAVLGALKPFEKQFPKHLVKNFKSELNDRRLLTAPIFAINEILKTEFFKSSNYRFNFYEINRKSLKDMDVSDTDNLKKQLQSINLRKIKEIKRNIQDTMEDMIHGETKDILNFYATINNVNALYNVLTEIEQEKVLEQIKITPEKS